MSASTTYLKSALAGIVAVVLALVLIPVVLLLVGVAYFTIAKAPQTSGAVPQTSGAVGWDPVSFLHQVPVLGLLPGWTPLIVLALLIFAAGFYWQFRRDSRKVAIRGHLR